MEGHHLAAGIELAEQGAKPGTKEATHSRAAHVLADHAAPPELLLIATSGQLCENLISFLEFSERSVVEVGGALPWVKTYWIGPRGPGGEQGRWP